MTQYRGLTNTREIIRHRRIYYVVSWRTGFVYHRFIQSVAKYAIAEYPICLEP
jgi:hypothetical protein